MRLADEATDHTSIRVSHNRLYRLFQVTLASLRVFASASRVPSTPGDRCGPFFDAELALQRSGYSDSVTLPGGNKWTEKYITRRDVRDILFCDGSASTLDPGFWDEDSTVYRAWLKSSRTVRSTGCCVYDFPNNEYEYCDPKSKDVHYCADGIPNATFFAEMGFVGQSCDSWGTLTGVLSGEISVEDVADECAVMERRIWSKKNVNAFKEPSVNEQ